MRTTAGGSPFTIIGENIHASRSYQRSGRHVVEAADGVFLRFEDADGEHRLPVPADLAHGEEFAQGKLKHVQVALLALLADHDPEASFARSYIQALARRQVDAGADYLDLNVDEVSADPKMRADALGLLVGIVEKLGSAAPALDSSSAEVLEAGVHAARDPGRLLLNSASIERLDVLDLAVDAGCGVVVTAAGTGGLPGDADERVRNAERIVAEATARTLPLDRLFVDPLVIPVAVEPEAGNQFLQAVERLRSCLGPRVHLTGGLSNVSFGLPGRRLVNDVFIDLAIQAGTDSGIIDPTATNVARLGRLDRSAAEYGLARDLLTGVDAYGLEFLAAFRAGRLAAAVT